LFPKLKAEMMASAAISIPFTIISAPRTSSDVVLENLTIPGGIEDMVKDPATTCNRNPSSENKMLYRN